MNYRKVKIYKNGKINYCRKRPLLSPQGLLLYITGYNE